MDFTLTAEQKMNYDTAKVFCEKELLPHEVLLERTKELPRELEREIRSKAIMSRLHAS